MFEGHSRWWRGWSAAGGPRAHSSPSGQTPDTSVLNKIASNKIPFKDTHLSLKFMNWVKANTLESMRATLSA
jgi:hypothetical protein